MIKRTWFLKLQDGWCSDEVSPSQRYQAIQQKEKDVARDGFEVRIFLAYTPLTLGHSQLEMKFKDKCVPEATRFKQAAELIEKALRVFGTVLPRFVLARSLRPWRI